MKKVIILLVLIAGYFGSQAQNDTSKYIWYKYQYGSRMDRYQADKVLSLPKDTSYSKDGVAVKNGLFYIGNGVKWTQLVSGTGTIATGNTYVVASTTAMLALSSAVVGDVAVTTDSSKSFILQSLPSSSLSNWVQLLFPASVPSVFGRTGPISAQYSDYSSFYQAIISNLSDTSKYLKKGDSTGNAGFATIYRLNLKLDSVTTSSDSTKLIYWHNGVSRVFYDIKTGLTGGDTTVFQTILDSTGASQQKVLWAANNKIHSDAYFIYDSARHKLVIGSKNISIGGTATKLYVVGNGIINGDLTAARFIKVGGTSAQYLMADGSVTTSAGGGSGITKVGSPAYGLTRINDSTYILDTTIAASQIRLHNDSVTLANATSANTSSIATKLNISDTANKWVQTVSLNTGGDSLIVVKNATRTAYKLPSGTGTPDTIHVQNMGAGTTTAYTNGSDTLIVKNIQATGGLTIVPKTDSSYAVDGSAKMNYTDTATALSHYVTSAVINNSGLLHTNPTVATFSGHTLTFTQTLANQSPYTVLGRASGTGVPSFLSSLDSNWIPSLHSEAYYNTKYGSGGGSSGLNATMAIDSATTHRMYSTGVIYTTDSLRAGNIRSKGGGMYADSIAIQTDSLIVYGTSIEAGSSGTGVTGTNCYPAVFASNITATLINKAIPSTSFRRKVGGSAADSAFMDRLYTIPNYSPGAKRYLTISGFFNDYTFNIGTGTLASELSRAIDTVTINRGWPLDRVIVVGPSLPGTYVNLGTHTPDSMEIYSNIALGEAKAKGVQYVDMFHFMKNNGGATLISPDSIHPTSVGQYIMSEAITYKIADIKAYNSIRVNRDLNVKGNSYISKIVIGSSISPNISGTLDWGLTPSTNGGLILLNNGSSHSELRYNSTNGNTVLTGRLLIFGVNETVTTADTTSAHSAMYIPDNSNIHTKGKVWGDGGVTTSNLIFPSGANASGTPNFGNTGNHGFLLEDGGSTSLRFGFWYGSSGAGYMFSRGGLPLYFGIGRDQSNLDSTTSAFMINPSNWLTTLTPIVEKSGHYSNYTAISANTTLTSGHNLIEVTSGTITVTLPTAVGRQGEEFWVTPTGSASVAIATTSSQTFANISGTPTSIGAFTIGTSYKFVSNNGNWLAFKMVN